MHDLDSALEVTAPEKGLKRKLTKPPENLNQDNESGPPKKIVLNRNSSVSSDTTTQKQNGFEVEDGQDKGKPAEIAEKKVIKLSELSVKEVRHFYKFISELICTLLYFRDWKCERRSLEYSYLQMQKK